MQTPACVCRVFVGQGAGSSGKGKKGSGGAAGAGAGSAPKPRGGEAGMKQSEQKQVRPQLGGCVHCALHVIPCSHTVKYILRKLYADADFGIMFNRIWAMQVLADFRAGKFNTLVATCIGEEGLDIPQVPHHTSVSCSRAAEHSLRHACCMSSHVPRQSSICSKPATG